jgi:hypothetical protein
MLEREVERLKVNTPGVIRRIPLSKIDAVVSAISAQRECAAMHATPGGSFGKSLCTWPIASAAAAQP